MNRLLGSEVGRRLATLLLALLKFSPAGVVHGCCSDQGTGMPDWLADAAGASALKVRKN